MDIYDTNAIIREAERCRLQITPSDRKEWAIYCCALKVLGFDESTFVALSWDERESRKVWKAERNPQRYVRSIDEAKAKVIYFAKQSGMDLKPFLLSQERNSQPRTTYRPKLTATRVEAPTLQKPTAPKVVRPIKATELQAAQARHQDTALFVWLCKEFEAVEVEQVFNAYRVGGADFQTAQGYRANLFPYINRDGLIVDCKIFHTDPTTGSRKTAPPVKRWSGGELQSTWLLAELMKQAKKDGKISQEAETHDYRAKWCNFGDHLLQEREADPVGVVESEKTALVLSLVYPSIIWVAVGSKNNLTPERFEPYRGRKVTIYPDRDGYEDKPREDGHGIAKGWRTIARELAAHGFAMNIDTTTERHPGKPHDDLADIVLRYRHGEQASPEPQTEEAKPQRLSPDRAEAVETWNDLKSRYPHLQELEVKFDLEPIKVERYEPTK